MTLLKAPVAPSGQPHPPPLVSNVLFHELRAFLAVVVGVLEASLADVAVLPFCCFFDGLLMAFTAMAPSAACGEVGLALPAA